jgi:hypothetical protein
MKDVVVTVPKWFWPEWISEGDAAGDPTTGEEWGFSVGAKPDVEPGDRCYVVAHGKLRGYALITRLHFDGCKWHICRQGGAVAVTIPKPIKGFQGFRYRWWNRAEEIPFPEWMTP